MAVASDTQTPPQELFERVQELQEALDATPQSPTRELAEELVRNLVRLYGVGLERMLSAVHRDAEPAEQIDRLIEDDVVSTLLLIHDLHPIPLADRVQEALESVRPYMESHGGNVELVSLEDGVARIHLRGSCSDCAASAVTLELAIKQALEKAAPDLEALEVEGVAPKTMDGPGLPMLTNSAPSGMELPVMMTAPAPAPSWHEVSGVSDLGEGGLDGVRIAGRDLVIANVEGTLLAYRDLCAGCGEPLHEGSLREGALACPSCGRAFFLPRAGRSLDGDGLQLEPVPLLRDAGRVKVALSI